LEKAFSLIDEGFLPWRRDFLLLKRFSLEEVFPWRRDFFLSAEGFSLARGFSLGEGVFPLGERVFPSGRGVSLDRVGIFFTRGREIFEGFSLGEGIFSPWLRFSLG